MTQATQKTILGQVTWRSLSATPLRRSWNFYESLVSMTEKQSISFIVSHLCHCWHKARRSLKALSRSCLEIKYGMRRRFYSWWACEWAWKPRGGGEKTASSVTGSIKYIQQIGPEIKKSNLFYGRVPGIASKLWETQRLFSRVFKFTCIRTLRFRN